MWLMKDGAWKRSASPSDKDRDMADTRRGGVGWTVERRATGGDVVERKRYIESDRPRSASRQEHASGQGRGRSADKPSDIPAKGCKDILLRVYRGISDDRILAMRRR